MPQPITRGPFCLQRFAEVDPFLREPETVALDSQDTGFEYARIGRVTALAVIIVNLAVILLAMLFFVVCVRICIHSGYYYKASAHQNRLISVEDSLKLTLQTQVGKFKPVFCQWCSGHSAADHAPGLDRYKALYLQMVYTIGQRLIFFFPITAMWFLGPTALLCTSVVVTAVVAMLDRWDPKNPTMHVQGVLNYSPPAAAEPAPAGVGPEAVSCIPDQDQVISAAPEVSLQRRDLGEPKPSAEIKDS